MSVWFFLFEVSFLLALPLGLRCLFSWKMRRMQETLRRADAEYRDLCAELDGLTGEIRRVSLQERQQQLRRSRLLARIEAARNELDRMRRPVVGRLAA